jgi:hypothetical protein
MTKEPLRNLLERTTPRHGHKMIDASLNIAEGVHKNSI